MELNLLPFDRIDEMMNLIEIANNVSFSNGKDTNKAMTMRLKCAKMFKVCCDTLCVEFMMLKVTV